MNVDATTELHAWMMAHEPELVDFLRRIVDMDTATENREGVEALASVMADAMRKIGFTVELKSVDAAVFFSSAEGNPDTRAYA